MREEMYRSSWGVQAVIKEERSSSRVEGEVRVRAVVSMPRPGLRGASWVGGEGGGLCVSKLSEEEEEEEGDDGGKRWETSIGPGEGAGVGGETTGT
jgi:hypothetical protein